MGFNRTIAIGCQLQAGWLFAARGHSSAGKLIIYSLPHQLIPIGIGFGQQVVFIFVPTVQCIIK